MPSTLSSKIVNSLYNNLSKSIPSPRTELFYKNNFELLVAVILSAQATDKIVNEVTPSLFQKNPDPQSFINCGENNLRILIKRIGLAPTKAKNIIKTCKYINEKHNGQVPNSRKELEKLPGVGRKTANVVLNEAFGEATIAVDTHVFRVANRTGLAKGTSVLETEKQLLKITPMKWKKKAHHYLLLHGRYVCKAKNFDCTECSINKECQFPNKTT